ncbi:MAG: hypothetical protein E7317_04220 [Clostridiales bacterium]|nr:hypothetical protein [Clostridiales bacterium]
MKKYEAPRLFVDEYAPDTMIASGGGSSAFTAKNGNPSNQNCYGYKNVLGSIVGENVCIFIG